MPSGLQGLFAGAVADPERVSIGDSDRALHAEDMTFHEARWPDAVVYPVTTAEVSAVLRLAAEHRVPVTPFGIGSSLEGHVIPVEGGITVDLSRMTGVQVFPEDLTAVVEAGARRSLLADAAGRHGLMFPVDPGADATFGGMAATNAAGTTTVRYGKMRPNVLGLEAVLPGGEVIRTGGRALKSSAGYDLTGLLVGSEGTLAVITELTLRLHGIPEHAVVMRISFPDVVSAVRCAVGAVAAGAAVTRLELLDELNVRTVNLHTGSAFPEAPCLFVEATGTEATIAGDLEVVLALAEAEGAIEWKHERDPTARARIWAARHNVAYSWKQLWPGTVHASSDTSVPLSQLPEAVALARSEIDRLGLRAGILGHVGDGNFHVGVTLDPGNDEQLAAWKELLTVLVADALERGGTCSGEHGIGIGKIGALEREHPDLLPLYRAIKRAFDPLGIMNPGKVVRG